ncbi:MAG: type I 3-dehydroquinate dehydratase [Verrucomicrobiota bacterium]
MATAHSAACLARLKELSSAKESVPFDFLELRADFLPSPIPSAPRPLLATVRHPSEGGNPALTDQDRRERVQGCLRLADLFDVELARGERHPEVLQHPRRADFIAIASFHDFEGMPAIDQLQEKIEQARERGFDLAKFAVTPKNHYQLADLVELLQTSPLPLALMGMGPLGPISRVVLGQAGSVLNYGYLNRPNAPGQLPAAELHRLLATLKRET